MINPMDLSGKHVIITGASSGIGRATCIQASKLGAKISLIARKEEKLRETISMMDGEGHKFFPYDLNNLDGIEELISQIVTKNGSIDGLVHSAGIGFNRPVKMSIAEINSQIMQINYYAFVEIIRAASNKKRTNLNASYVGVSSVSSLRGFRAQGLYAASKGAMNALVHPFAKELASKGIRVNTVVFGMVDTDMYKEFIATGGNKEELLRDQFAGIIPVEYAANAICFLLSDVSKYMTGGTFNYDAGLLS